MKKILFPPLMLSLLTTMAACSQQQVSSPEAVEVKVPVKRFLAHKPRVHKPRVQQPQIIKTQPQHRSRPIAHNRAPYKPTRSRQELTMIGDKIFKNEAGGIKSKLVHWNVGENFAAMGIGHFTWYPSGPRRHRFGNTFPGLLGYLEKNGEVLPAWLQHAKRNGAPWNSRTALMRAKGSRQVNELEDLLYRTRHLQAEYIIKRAQRAMPKLVKKTPSRLRTHVADNLNAVANTPGGWYALVDYVNFKGEGLNRHGGYKGQNWGLLQVLENMHPSRPGSQALSNFSSSALAILTRRVRNSPKRRNEARWLRGWTKRVNTYRYPLITRI